MDKITMLGTGHAMTFDCFNTCFVYENEQGKLLVDTGGGGQLLRQLRDAGIRSDDISHVFISHRHTDHLLGLPWLFRGPVTGQLTLYLHEELMETVRGMLALLFPDTMAKPPENVRFVPVRHGDEAEILSRRVRFLDLHSPNVTQYGFVLWLDETRRLAFHGDVPFHESNRAELQNVDWLLHEAFNLEREGPGGPGGPPPGGMAPPPGGPGGNMGPPPEPSEAGSAGRGRARERSELSADAGSSEKRTLRGRGPGHSTVKQAASYAQSLGVKNLVLFHGSDNDLPHRQEKYTAEARTAYDGTIYVPYDLDVIEL